MAVKEAIAETLARGSEESVELTEAKHKYVFKLDMRLIPILGCTYTILFLDRTNIANARIEGLEAGLNMPANGYNTCIWIFFIPFVLVEIPSNLIMSLPRVRPNIFLGVNMFILGIIATCQGLTASYGGLLALRFLMGIFEATLPAGAAFLIGEYYTRKEQSLRFACFFTFAVLGPAISGLLAFAIRNMNGVQGMASWRWIFILEGLCTVAISFPVFLLVPDFPERTKILSPEEKAHLLAKLKHDRGDQELDMRSVKWIRVFTDYKIWFPTLMFFCCDMTASSMSAFIPTILTEMGYGTAIAQLLTIPVWITGVVFQIFGCWVSGRIGWRFPFILFGICFAMIGWIIQVVYGSKRGLAPGIRYFSLFAMSGGTFIQMSMTTAWMTNNLRGRASTAVGTAIILGLGNCANFVSANVFVQSEAPYYPRGFRTGLALTIAGAGACLIYLGLLWWHNRKLERKRSERGGLDDQIEYRYQY